MSEYLLFAFTVLGPWGFGFICILLGFGLGLLIGKSISSKVGRKET